MFSALTVNAIGVLFLVLFGVFYFLGIFATTRAVLAFTGTCILGTAGFFGSMLHAAGSWLVSLADSGTAWAFGIGIGGTALTVAVLVVFIHDLHPRNTAGKRTGWAGVLLAALLVAGVSGIPALNHIPGSVQQGVTNAKTVVGG